MQLVPGGVALSTQPARLAPHEAASRLCVPGVGFHLLPQELADEAGHARVSLGGPDAGPPENLLIGRHRQVGRLIASTNLSVARASFTTQRDPMSRAAVSAALVLTGDRLGLYKAWPRTGR